MGTNLKQTYPMGYDIECYTKHDYFKNYSHQPNINCDRQWNSKWPQNQWFHNTPSHKKFRLKTSTICNDCQYNNWTARKWHFSFTGGWLNLHVSGYKVEFLHKLNQNFPMCHLRLSSKEIGAITRVVADLLKKGVTGIVHSTWCHHGHHRLILNY